jgi:hypothetical protein
LLIKHFIGSTPNLGDTAIAAATRQLLFQMFPGSEILTLRVNRGYYNAGNHFVDFPSISPEQDALSGINSSTTFLGGKPDLIVIGGGPLWGSVEHTQFRMDPASLGDTPVMFLGVGTRSDLSHSAGLMRLEHRGSPHHQPGIKQPPQIWIPMASVRT